MIAKPAALLVIVLLAGAVGLAALATRSGSERMAKVGGALRSNGSGPDPAPPPRLVGKTDPGENIDFSLVLNRRDAELKKFLRDLQDPEASEYRRFLDAKAYGERFGVEELALVRLKADLAEAGLRVTRALPQRTALGVNGTAAEVERLFDVELRDFVDGRGKPFHAPAANPVVPAALRGAVDTVAGLNTRQVLQPRAVPEGKPLKPETVATAYNTAPLRDMGINGEGQTVAIMSFDTFDPADVAEFDRLTGTEGPPVEKVPVNGGVSAPGDGAVEVNLDIDTIRTVAPKAQILDYEAPGTNFLDDLADMTDQILADGRADTASLSWGTCEAPGILEEPDIQRVLRSLEAAVTGGVTIYEASGDWGAYCGISNDESLVDDVLPDFPGSSPNLVTVGGTLLHLREDGTYLEETAWEDVFARRATGGGNSLGVPRPEFQAGEGVDNPHSTGMRQIPDVAGPADPDSGILTVTDGQVAAGGGTSQAAPFFAGAMLLVRQYVERESGRKGLGYTNPLFYELAAGEDGDVIFHDVTKGGDLLHNAGPGWDYATGLGTPDVFNLAKGINGLLEQRGG
jgi:kumamolisin